MLLFVDQPKQIKVFRLEENSGGVKRNRIGSVQKNKLEPPEDLVTQLNPEEHTELQGVIALYGNISDAQVKVDVARFPEIVRNVVEYMTSGKAADLEKRVLATALTEAVRMLRKSDHAQQD